MTNESTGSSGEQPDTFNLTLPLHLEIVLDKEADRKFVRTINGCAIRRNLSMFWMRNVVGYAGLALGIYSSLVSGMVLMGCMIATMMVWLFQQHRVVAMEMAEAGASVVDRMRVSVVINEQGFVEKRGDIEARFGWSALRWWMLSEDILYIQLSSGAWAWLPGKGMEPATLRLEDLASLLASKGVAGGTSQPVASAPR